MVKGEMGEFKIMLAAMIDTLVRDAIERGQPTEPIFRALGAESLELAARIHVNHGGTETCFLGMAKDLLDHVRIGAREQ